MLPYVALLTFSQLIFPSVCSGLLMTGCEHTQRARAGTFLLMYIQIPQVSVKR